MVFMGEKGISYIEEMLIQSIFKLNDKKKIEK